MLQVEPMAFRDFPIDSLFYPSYLINQSVSPFVKHIECKSVFVVDHPDEKETALLDFVERNVQDLLVTKSTVSDSHTSRWVG